MIGRVGMSRDKQVFIHSEGLGHRGVVVDGGNIVSKDKV